MRTPSFFTSTGDQLRWTAVVGLVALLALVLPGSPAEQAAEASHCPGNGATFEPPDGSTLLIVGQDWLSTEEYVDAIGVVPGGFMTYSALAAPVAGLHLPVHFGGVSYGQWFVDNYADVTMNVAVTMDPDQTNLGLVDAQIDVLGQWITAAQRPVFLRPGYEFDHRNKEHDPDAFITAWRRVVDRLRANGVDNVAYVWHSAGHGTYRNLPSSAWYPGDDYVDWVAVSIFGRGFTNANQSMVRANELADIADAHGKPLMIAESTPLGRDTSVNDPTILWDDWFTNVIDFIETRDVKAWSYINQDWETLGWSGWGDSRVQNNPALEARWRDEIARDRYLQQSPSLFCELGHH